MNTSSRRDLAIHNASDDRWWCQTRTQSPGNAPLCPAPQQYMFNLHISWTISQKLRTLSCSVGNGPPPTRVVYAFMTPMTFPMRRGGMPRPVQTPPTVVELLVTYG